MFRLAGIEKEKLHEALIKMGKKHLKTKAMKDNWSEDNPTKNYCYVIAEFVYYYLSPKGSKPFKLPGIPGDASGQERIREAAKHGFKKAIVPSANAPKQAVRGIEVCRVERISQVLELFDES